MYTYNIKGATEPTIPNTISNNQSNILAIVVVAGVVIIVVVAMVVIAIVIVVLRYRHSALDLQKNSR